MKHYFHYSAKVKAITFVVLVLVVTLTLKLVFSSLPQLVLIGAIAICWFPLLASVSFAPWYYVEDEQGVTLRLLCYRIFYPATQYSREHCDFTGKGTVRLFASGGLFGFWGWFYSRDMGRFLLFGTNGGTRYLKLTHARTGKVVLIQE